MNNDRPITPRTHERAGFLAIALLLFGIVLGPVIDGWLHAADTDLTFGGGEAVCGMCIVLATPAAGCVEPATPLVLADLLETGTVDAAGRLPDRRVDRLNPPSRAPPI